MGFQIENGVLTEYIEEEGVTDIIIPNHVKHIQSYVFTGLQAVTSVIIPDSVVKIEKKAFLACLELTSVEIGNGVQSIGNGAFSFCKNLKNISVSEQNPYFTSEDGVLYDKEMKTLIACPAGKNSVTIPDGVTVLETDALYGCQKLYSVTIPDTVTHIKANAFWGCENLRKIVIPQSVNFIDRCVFHGCRNITDFHFVGRCKAHGDFKKFGEFDSVIDSAFEMIQTGKFTLDSPTQIKSAFIVGCYKETRNPETLDYISQYLPEIMLDVIKSNDIEAVEAFTETDGIFTQENIDRFIKLAIGRGTQEIYLLLLNYKAEKLGFKDIPSQFKL